MTEEQIVEHPPKLVMAAAEPAPLADQGRNEILNSGGSVYAINETA